MSLSEVIQALVKRGYDIMIDGDLITVKRGKNIWRSDYDSIVLDDPEFILNSIAELESVAGSPTENYMIYSEVLNVRHKD